MHVKARVARQPGLDLGVFVGDVVVHDQMQVQIGWGLLVDLAQEVQELLVPMLGANTRDHLSVGHIECGEQGRRAVANVVVGDPLDVANPMGSTGCVRSSAWIWLFSSTHSTSAWSGGFRYSPVMSRTFSTKARSLDSLKLRERCGAMPAARNWRCAMSLLMLASAAKLRTLQCVCLAGRVCKALFNSGHQHDARTQRNGLRRRLDLATFSNSTRCSWCNLSAASARIWRILASAHQCTGATAYSSTMRSATFPPIRVEPEVRAEVEAVLREGESLTQFIEEAVVAAAAWRRVQSEFVTRGEAAIERWKQEGGGHTVDEVMVDLQARLDDAKQRAAQRAGR